MIWAKKIRGGALQFVLFIGALIAVLLMAFVLLSYSHILFKKKTDVTVELIQAADKGLEYSFGKLWSSNEVLENPKDNGIGIQTKIQRNHWGILELRSASAQKGKLQFTKMGFVGQANENRPALYLKENQRPMVIAGDAKITGTAYLPERGIKMGNIQGYGYTKSQLIYGEKQRSTSKLPELDEAVTQQLKKTTQFSFEPQGNEVGYKKGMVVKNSFKEETQIIKGFLIDLELTQLTGNIMVWATNKIVVHSSAQLQDVILVAPHIQIQDGVSGNFQALASEQIAVGKNCLLDYPSVLAVQRPKTYSKEKDQSNTPNIFLEKGTSVSGMVVYLDENEENGLRAHIKIEENAQVLGEVYCTQNLELKGSVVGSVTTNALVALENGNIYQNHLFHGRIDAPSLPSEYAALPLADQPANQVMKWLY
ncbi:hypothetical protein [Flagellimonas meishanensis]|uniref:hypothetical protein n=1 Tax=Flagellimonas meishanensis TaxID=2873264 RepID=UPI001CA61D08|nr:hypothetical protein [[Muricauda] meishanensis]